MYDPSRDFDDRFLEQQLIGQKLECVNSILGHDPVVIQHDQAIYVLRRYIFGLFSKRLYVYLQEGRVVDFYIGIL